MDTDRTERIERLAMLAEMQAEDMTQPPKDWVREWFAALPELAGIGVLDRETAIRAQCELADLAVAAWQGNIR